MVGDETPSCPIAGEPALLDALEMVDEIIDQHLNPHLWVLDESTKVDDLKTLRATMQKATYNPLTPVDELLEASDAIDNLMVPSMTTLEVIEQAQSRMDRLHMNATGIVDSLARNVITDMASDVMTSLQAAHDAQTRDLMALRAMVVQACNEAPLENEVLLEQTLVQVDTMLGITEPKRITYHEGAVTISTVEWD